MLREPMTFGHRLPREARRGPAARLKAEPFQSTHESSTRSWYSGTVFSRAERKGPVELSVRGALAPRNLHLASEQQVPRLAERFASEPLCIARNDNPEAKG